MKVYKFGGASINSIERMKNTAGIIAAARGEKLLVVISALGKVTNALEKVAEAFFDKRTDEALALFEEIKQQHVQIIKDLLNERAAEAEAKLKEFFTEIEWLLHDEPVRSYDYYYDQIVCCGEMFSTTIMYFHLLEAGLSASWIDVRDIIRTDNNFRDAKVDFEFTKQQVLESVESLLVTHEIIITQGFCGATDENESTTLGREGSDYTAAIFANLMGAESLTIWKDVESVMSADPRRFPEAVSIPQLSYAEVIEMAYYGAQVIHPKTIKPLQNRNIPLYVKSFIDPSLAGTVINNDHAAKLPPVIVLKENQLLIQFRSRDFSFIEGAPVEQLHRIFEEAKQQPNLSQNTAISLLCCFDDLGEKTERLAAAAAEIFDVEVEKNLSLLTIRHYNEEALSRYVDAKNVVLEQRTRETVVVVVRASS